MNTRTTFLLALVLVGLAGLYYVRQSRTRPADVITPSPSRGVSPVARDLIEEKLGDVVRVVCKKKDAEEWVFEKDEEASENGRSVWRMTSPIAAKCVSWEVDKFSRQLGDLQYEISYGADEAGAVTAEKAGLNPPQAVVTLTDTDGKTVSVKIGRPASGPDTYVGLADDETVYVAMADLRILIKDKPLEYRDKQLWNFKSEDVTRVDVTDRSDADNPVSYEFVRDAGNWMLASPVTARATSKVDDMLRSMSRLRVAQWSDDGAGKLAMYGLEPAAWTVRVTAETEVPVEEDAVETGSADEPESQDGPEPQDEPKEPKTRTETSVYTIHVSDRGPIGEDTKAYVRIGDETSVATLYKSTADQFKPVMAEWREMRITTVAVGDAKRIEIATPTGPVVLVKNEEEWSFEGDGGRAESTAVSELLDAIGALEAVAIIDDATDDPAAYGLDKPQVTLALTIPGVEAVERIAVGGHTDASTKRLVFVRRNGLPSVAKVRQADVAKLIRPARFYRDRMIVEVLPSRFERIALSTENRYFQDRTQITLEQNEGEWKMTGPVESDVSQDRIDDLVSALGGLRAEQVVADDGEASAFGLHTPAISVTLTYTPQVEHRIEQPTGDGDSAEHATQVEVEPSSQTLELAVTEHDGSFYAKRSDRPTIYRVGDDLASKLGAEFRPDRVLDFDDKTVLRFSIRSGDITHGFEKKDGVWIYSAEPDLPLDSTKVMNLLLQIRDLRTERYVRHTSQDLESLGLSAPANEVKVTTENGTDHVLRVSAQKATGGPDAGQYATVAGRDGVFLLTAETIKRFEVSLDSLDRR